MSKKTHNPTAVAPRPTDLRELLPLAAMLLHQYAGFMESDNGLTMANEARELADALIGATRAPMGAQDGALRLAHALDGGKLIDDSTEWADTLHTAAETLRSLHIEVTEQARLLGISAERERAFRARVRELERAVAAEREACARMAEQAHPHDWAFIGAAIRARGAQGESNG